MEKKNAKEILKELVELILERLDDLKDVTNSPTEQFTYGEKTAYIEIAEVLQNWKNADKSGLDFDIEDKYPLM